MQTVFDVRPAIANYRAGILRRMVCCFVAMIIGNGLAMLASSVGRLLRDR